MDYKQGDVVLVKFPFTNLAGSKKRPAIIVSNKDVNRSGDYVVVMLTTQPIDGKFATTISNEEMSTPFKPPVTINNVYCKKVAVLDSSVILAKISEVTDSEKMQTIINKIKSVFTLD